MSEENVDNLDLDPNDAIVNGEEIDPDPDEITDVDHCDYVELALGIPPRKRVQK